MNPKIRYWDNFIKDCKEDFEINQYMQNQRFELSNREKIDIPVEEKIRPNPDEVSEEIWDSFIKNNMAKTKYEYQAIENRRRIDDMFQYLIESNIIHDLTALFLKKI